MDFVREHGFGLGLRAERKMRVQNYGNTGALDMLTGVTCLGGVASVG